MQLWGIFNRVNMRGGDHPQTYQCNIHRPPLSWFNFGPLHCKDASCNIKIKGKYRHTGDENDSHSKHNS
jgi:hypothetical protein